MTPSGSGGNPVTGKRRFWPGGIFGSNSYNRQKFGLGEARTPLWTALLLIAVGLACAFGLKGPGTELALAALALHLVWSLLQGRVGK